MYALVGNTYMLLKNTCSCILLFLDYEIVNDNVRTIFIHSLLNKQNLLLTQN